MTGLVGGLILGGLVGWAIFGPCAWILIVCGIIAASCKLSLDRQAEKQAESWRKNYPTYKY